MSTIHHQVVGKRNNREHANSPVKTHSGVKPCIFSGNVASGVAEVGSLFPRFCGSIWKVVHKMHTRLYRKLNLHFKMLKIWRSRSTFGRWSRQLVQQTVARARWKEGKNWHLRSSPGFVWTGPRCWRCANIGRFGATLLLFGFATGCNKTNWDAGRKACAMLRGSWLK